MDGEPMPSWRTVFDTLGVAAEPLRTDLINGRVLPGQSWLRTLKAHGEECAERVLDAYFEDQRLASEVCYCSVYDGCWRVVSEGIQERREPVPACEAGPRAAL